MIYPWFGCLPVLAVLNDQVWLPIKTQKKEN
jgi:hypothetical protein